MGRLVVDSAASEAKDREQRLAVRKRIVRTDYSLKVLNGPADLHLGFGARFGTA
jgi:hypothetical protein